jgi:hypothetical protein
MRGSVCAKTRAKREREEKEGVCVFAQVPFSFAPGPPTPPCYHKENFE